MRSLLAQGLKGVVGLGTWDSDPVSLSLPSTSPFNKRTFLLRSWRVGDRGLVEEKGESFEVYEEDFCMVLFFFLKRCWLFFFLLLSACLSSTEQEEINLSCTWHLGRAV